jgi:hypothetical protein
MKAHRNTLFFVFGFWMCLVTTTFADQPLLGMTFTHYKIDPNAICTNGRESAQVMAEGSIIAQYDAPAVRETVRDDLAQTKSAGFDLIRTVIWFTEDRINVPWGQIKAPLNSLDAQNIAQYGADIKAAGFQRWMVVLGPGVRSSPVCKIRTWGDCWLPQRTDPDIAFVEAVYRDIHSLAGPNFEIEYDLSGELCPSQYLSSSTNQNIDSYLSKLIVSFRKIAPDAPIHVSCGGFSDDRAEKVLMLFKTLGIAPNAIDIHLYDVDAAMIRRKLLPAAELAKEYDIPLEIGEMQYENDRQAKVIGELARQYSINFSELIQWPRTGLTKCQINVNPPFSDRVIESEIVR